MTANKKRILFIDGPLGGGGAERVLIDILRHIDYDRYEVDLVVICRGGALMTQVPNQVKVIELWNGYSWDYKLGLRLSKWLRCNRLLSRKMNGKKLRRDYDIEISFLEGMPTKLGALRTTPSKKAAWVHADLYNDRYEEAQFYPGEELKAYNKMDVIINVSHTSQEAFVKRFPECETNKVVIYNPIDAGRILKFASKVPLNKTNDGVKTIITVGRLSKPKNPWRFLEVAKMTKDSKMPVKFKWIGDGELRKEMEDLRERWDLNGTVEFTGFQSNPYPEIRDADLLISTSDYESFGLVIAEAMLLGTPVIATPTSGAKELIGLEKCGFLTEFSSVSILEAIQRFFENPRLMERNSLEGKCRCDAFSMSESLNRLYRLL